MGAGTSKTTSSPASFSASMSMVSGYIRRGVGGGGASSIPAINLKKLLNIALFTYTE